MNTFLLNVEGMRCDSSVNQITAALRALTGVTAVEVDLAVGQVSVSGSADVAALLAALQTAGYPAQASVSQMPAAANYVPALGFHWLTPFYDVVIGATTRERSFKQALIQQADFAPNQEVLDLASGTGTLAIWIKTAHPQVNITGVDGDPAILSLATQKAVNAGVSVQFKQALSYDLPYSDASFDRVVSSLFFHHLSWENKERTAQELLRVLKPGAQLHIADWGQADNALMRGLFYSIQLLDGFKNTQDNVRGKLINLFKNAGFIDVTQQKTFSTMYGTMSLYRAFKPS